MSDNGGADEHDASGEAEDGDDLSLDALMSILEDLYASSSSLRPSAAVELPLLRDSLGTLLPVLESQYRPIGAFKPGGGGVPILLRDIWLNNQRRVLKLPRPVLLREQKLNRILAHEAERLSEVHHAKIIRILSVGVVPGTEIPYYIMECIDDPKDADDYVAEHPSVETLVQVVSDIVEAIAQIHSKSIVHTDIKPANIFVDQDGNATLADFGFAKRIDQAGVTVGLGGTAGFMHPEQVSLLASLSSSKVDRAEPERQMADDLELERADIRPYWDLYSLGMTVFVFLMLLEQKSPKLIKDFRIRYLKLMAYRLVGTNLESARGNSSLISRDLVINETIFGITQRDIKELQYVDISEVKYDLQKLVGTVDLASDIPELSAQPEQVIHASSTAAVPFTDRVRRVVDSAEVRRLGTLLQLGLINMVYPTATHSRLEHTLGTFGMACRYVRALYEDPINPIFKQIMRPADLEALLLAALLHDIGHYPLAHDLEEIHPSIFSHENRTKHLLQDTDSGIVRLLADSSRSGWNVSAQSVLDVLESGAHAKGSSFRQGILAAILDGPIDADKGDYLRRDSESLRVPYGQGIDLERLLASVTVVMVPRDPHKEGSERFPSIGIHERAKVAAESMAFARYALYGSVYWHRTHRTLKAMLNQVGYEVLDAAHLDSSGSRRRDQDITRSLRTDLYRYLEHRGQARLALRFADERTNDRVQGTFLDLETEGLLEWLRERSPERTSHLVADLGARRLYQRILVASEYRREMDWDVVRAAFMPRGQREAGEMWFRRLAFAKGVQAAIVERVAGWDGVVRAGVSKVDLTEKERFLAEAPRRQLILVDYPISKVGARTELSFLCEPEWSGSESESFEAVAADRSPIWKAVAEQLQESLAKLRVYCDPDFAGIVSSIVSRGELLEMVVEELERDPADPDSRLPG